MSELRYNTYSGPDDIGTVNLRHRWSKKYGIGWFFEENHEPTPEDWLRVLNMESNAWYRQITNEAKIKVLLASIAVRQDIIIKDYC